jgi:hypothetical protein
MELFMKKFHRELQNLRIILGVLSIVILSGVTGSALGLQYATRHVSSFPINSSLFLAIKGPTIVHASDQAEVNAVTQERVTELKQDAQASQDDRKVLHDEIFKLAQTENVHYNAIHEQIAVDEARLNSYTGLFGGGVTLLTAISIILQLFDRKRRRKLDFEGDKHYDDE